MILFFFIFCTILFSTEMTIDASDWDSENWTYLNLGTSNIVFPDDPTDNLSWDIAFHRYHIRTNSGLSGKGNGGAYIDSANTWDNTSYELVVKVPEISFFNRDTLVGGFYDDENYEWASGIANPALETWGKIDLNNDYQMEYSNNQFIVRNALGTKFFKFWATDYYNQFNTSGFITIKFEEVNSCDLGHDDCGECGGDNSSCAGCVDGENTENGDGVDACNYNPMSFIDDGSCEYTFPSGCSSCDCASIEEDIILKEFSLFQNYPNPFNPTTNISFDISFADQVSLIIYDLKGSIITKLVDAYLFPGSYLFTWDPSQMDAQVSSGVYIYTLSNSEGYVSKRMLLVK